MATTYAELQSEIKDYTNRDDLEAEYLTNIVTSSIRKAEERLNRILFVPDRETVAPLTATGETVALPVDFWAMRAAYADGDTKRLLVQISLSDLRVAYPVGAAGIPLYYAIQGNGMVLGPEPSGSTGIIINYYQTIPQLTATNTSNWLLSRHSDLYLQAALVEAYQFLRDNDALMTAEGRTQSMIEDLNRAARKQAHGGIPLAASVRRGWHAHSVRW